MRRLLAFVLIATTAFPQSPTVNDESRKAEPSDFVVRLNVNLVQVDAAVTDSKGRPVKGLTADDFEVFQDGVQQKITNFSYVEEGVKVPVAALARKGEPPVPAPPVELNRQQVRRSIVLVVDDLGLSFENMARVRIALKKFVDDQMQPRDMVAIVRTGAGIGALQQFTTDKRLLYAAINQIKFSFLARAASFAPMDVGRTLQRPGVSGPGRLGADVEAERYANIAGADACMNDTMSSMGSLGAIRYVIDGLRDMPGRKALILFSQQLQIQERPDRVGGTTACDYDGVRQLLRRLTDAAERSAVVIYSIDPLGLATLAPGADYNPFGGGPVKGSAAAAVNILNTDLKNRSVDYQFSLGGLEQLAADTGGTLATHNDISGAIREAVDDASNFYVIGYHPPASTFDAKRGPISYHRITVKVKRSGLHVRSRNGFFGFQGEEPGNAALTPGQQLARVLASPFAQNDVPLRMTTFFSKTNKPLVTTLLYLDAKNLSFRKQADGKYQATIDAIAMAFDADGGAINSTQAKYTFSTTEQDYRVAMQNGIILTLQYPVLKPGPYQMRVAVRDEASDKMGSANQFIEVPNLKRKRLALSGILMKQLSAAEASAAALTWEPSLTTREAVATPDKVDSKGNEAIRIFKAGERVGWFYQIFNAKRGPDQHVNVSIQVRVFLDGKEVIQSDPAVAHLPENTAADYVPASGHMVIGTKLSPGDYALQLIVTDNLAKKKYATASQWVGFEIEKPQSQASE
jgi:VWFA-related protein